jgi:capsular exopolysaccharide synthesis family protein
LAKRDGLRIEAAQRQVPWQLLTPPAAPSPSSASAKRQLVLGVGLGFLLGLGAALLTDRLSNMIHTTREIKEITKVPLLGTIPISRSLSSRQLPANYLSVSTQSDDGHRFPSQLSTPFQEAFRTLYANLRFTSPDSPIRSVVISSPVSDDGKTTTAFYLAHVAAAAGRRVLLVDTDLRHPRLHQYLNIPSGLGLTDSVLSGTDLLDVVHPLAWESNLFILPCGSLPPDPTRILASQSMQQFMAKALELFDLVIYDMPPLLGFSDAYFLAPHTDGLMLVVRLHHLKRVYLEQVMEELRVPAVPILGVVANAVDEVAAGTLSNYQFGLEPHQRSSVTILKGKITRQAKQLLERFPRPRL